MFEPAIDMVAPLAIHRLDWIERIVDDNKVSAFTQSAASHGRCESLAPACGDEFMLFILVAG